MTARYAPIEPDPPPLRRYDLGAAAMLGAAASYPAGRITLAQLRARTGYNPTAVRNGVDEARRLGFVDVDDRGVGVTLLGWQQLGAGPAGHRWCVVKIDSRGARPELADVDPAGIVGWFGPDHGWGSTWGSVIAGGRDTSIARWDKRADALAAAERACVLGPYRALRLRHAQAHAIAHARAVDAVLATLPGSPS